MCLFVYVCVSVCVCVCVYVCWVNINLNTPHVCPVPEEAKGVQISEIGRASCRERVSRSV